MEMFSACKCVVLPLTQVARFLQTHLPAFIHDVMLIMFASVKQIQLTYSLDVQLDLGYPATSYPDISIIRLRSCSVYSQFFIHFHPKSCSKQKQSG